MRLKPEKIEYLARQVVEAFKKIKKVEFAAPIADVEGGIKRVILADLKREDDLEKEAEEILKVYKQKISMQNLSYNTLVTKTKQELAKKKKIIL
ncbi:MAG: DUF507 family protein [Candidatus Sumerlaeaceae bacterium]|nr:DUF507 family protein [Candidatus Sumerlaeaceae bacterium]